MAKRRVVIVAPDDDVHAKAVAQEIESRGGKVTVYDTRAFPLDSSVSSYRSGTSGSLSIRAGQSDSNAERILCENEPFSVWWRRPRGHSLADVGTLRKLREISFQESRQMLLGSLIAGADLFINDIGCSARASFKPLQLKIASEAGIRIPKTIFTNDRTVAEEFFQSTAENVIYKTFTGLDVGMYETRLLKREDISELWRLRNAPIILQEHIEGDYDLRVTIVGEHVFAAKVFYRLGSHPIDSRVDRVPLEETILPTEISEKLQIYRKRMGLMYLAADLRYSDSEGYTFFEANPEGQYLWIEIETGLPISAGIAELLVGD